MIIVIRNRTASRDADALAWSLAVASHIPDNASPKTSTEVSTSSGRVRIIRRVNEKSISYTITSL